MEKLLKDFHVLESKIGPIAFHGPSAKLFELPADVAAAVAALEIGGEPLLNLPLIQHIIDRCREKTEPHGIRMAFNMTSNGTVWNEKIADFVAKNIDTVTVSLDGPKDINDAQRPALGGFSPYEKTLRTIAGQTVLAVAADGDLYPCHRFVGYEDFRLGNVNDEQPLDNKHIALRDAFKETPVDKNPHCGECWARHLCGGSCYVISHLREGDVFKPPASYCHLKKTAYGRLLGEVAEIMADPARKPRFVDNVKSYFQ